MMVITNWQLAAAIGEYSESTELSAAVSAGGSDTYRGRTHTGNGCAYGKVLGRRTDCVRLPSGHLLWTDTYHALMAVNLTRLRVYTIPT
eukprot:scaffold2696_cov144-Skeletonema_marinoi.AAC.2